MSLFFLVVGFAVVPKCFQKLVELENHNLIKHSKLKNHFSGGLPCSQDCLHGTDGFLLTSDQEGDIAELWEICQEAEVRT